MSNKAELKRLETTINYEDTKYTFSIITTTNIIEVYLFKEEDIDKFKNFFTYDRLLRRSLALKTKTSSLIEAAELIINAVKEGSYSLNINFSKSYLTLKVKLDVNSINNSALDLNNLEIFLYKTDSKQYDTTIDALKVEIEKLNLENESQRNQNSSALVKLEELVSVNESLKREFKELIDTINSSSESTLDTLREDSENTIEDLEIRLKKNKQDLLNSYKNPRIYKEKLYFYIPIINYLEKEDILKKWFKCSFELVLAYDSIDDGDTSQAFHSKCDGKIQTLTLIETMQGRRFGGYTKLFWDHSESYKSDDDAAFIFSIDKKEKFNCSDQNKVIYCSNKQGPTFGKGPDIFISNEFLTNDSTSKIQGSFGEKDDLNKQYTNANYLAGIEVFRVKRIEVYQVIFK